MMNQADVVISGKDINSYVKCCVYVWMRGDICMYVGASTKGLGRVLNNHHIINKGQNHVQDDDRLELYYVRYEDISRSEAAFIQARKPILNKLIY